MMTDTLPEAPDVERVVTEKRGTNPERVSAQRVVLSRKGQGEAVRVVSVRGPKFDGRVVVWVHPDGVASLRDGDRLVPAAQKIIDANAGILAVEVLRTGATAQEPRPPVNKGFAGYTFGYNRPLVAERVHDILTAVAYARGDGQTKSVHLVGFDRAGPWVALARGLCGDKVGKAAADANGFRFEQVKDANDEMMLPGALRYGGLLTLAAAGAPGELFLHNTKGAGPAAALEAAYRAQGQAERLRREDAPADPVAVVTWLLR
jgi:hypothetical protein